MTSCDVSNLTYPAIQTISRRLSEIAEKSGDEEIHGIAFMLDALADKLKKSLEAET